MVAESTDDVVSAADDVVVADGSIDVVVSSTEVVGFGFVVVVFGSVVVVVVDVVVMITQLTFGHGIVSGVCCNLSSGRCVSHRVREAPKMMADPMVARPTLRTRVSRITGRLR